MASKTWIDSDEDAFKEAANQQTPPSVAGNNNRSLSNAFGMKKGDSFAPVAAKNPRGHKTAAGATSINGSSSSGVVKRSDRVILSL